MAYLKDTWYCASWAGDLVDAPVGIKILGEDIALYRDSTGKASAVSGRCPHRFAPLSKGKVKGDVIECPYHGLQFDCSGTCVVNPHGRGIIPPRARLKSYALVEKHGVLWIWMGDAANADPSKIIDLPFIVDKRYAVVTGRLPVKADYQLMIDNLLDLTHVAYIHPTTVGLPPEHIVGETKMDYKFESDGRVVKSNYSFFNVPPTAQLKHIFKDELGDVFVYVTWHPASSFYLDIGMSPRGVAKGDVANPTDDVCLIPSAHLIVPETEDTCHYFYALSRNIDIHNEEEIKEMRDLGHFTFTQEDGPIVEDCYGLMGKEDFFDLEPAILETDRAAIQARRILARLIASQVPAVRDSPLGASASDGNHDRAATA
jgi:phenylpropionate dioxygenase-like ring-hydroxylating dioxygenase large terminal subunit